jgi:hypothetical protein
LPNGDRAGRPIDDVDDIILYITESATGSILVADISALR